jgi:hypothetical protein
MPLPTFKTLEEIPEAFRSEYEQVENEWRPKAVRTDDDVQKTKAALDSEREQRKAEEKARKAAEKERDDLKRAADAKAKGISEEELQKIRDAEAAARKPIEDERDRLIAENRKLKLDDKVRALYLKHDGMSDRVDDAMDQLLKRAELGDADGIVFKDEKGQVTADDAETFFKKFRAAKPFYFKGSGASGSGAEGSNGSGNGAAPRADAKVELEEKQRTIASAL